MAARHRPYLPLYLIDIKESKRGQSADDHTLQIYSQYVADPVLKLGPFATVQEITRIACRGGKKVELGGVFWGDTPLQKGGLRREEPQIGLVYIVLARRDFSGRISPPS